ncbi:hypothetical protein HDU88_007369 [Geranomyces variabilis]|nr:hypothetical protein HDU88_007369 [Geranomyces variabilis]
MGRVAQVYYGWMGATAVALGALMLVRWDVKERRRQEHLRNITQAKGKKIEEAAFV